MQEDRQTTKEEGRKEEDRQEGADVKKQKSKQNNNNNTTNKQTNKQTNNNNNNNNNKKQCKNESVLSCLSSSLLPSSFVVYLSSCATRRSQFWSKALCTNVSLCFVVLVSTFPKICSVLSASPAVVHSFPFPSYLFPSYLA